MNWGKIQLQFTPIFFTAIFACATMWRKFVRDWACPEYGVYLGVLWPGRLMTIRNQVSDIKGKMIKLLSEDVSWNYLVWFRPPRLYYRLDRNYFIYKTIWWWILWSFRQNMTEDVSRLLTLFANDSATRHRQYDPKCGHVTSLPTSSESDLTKNFACVFYHCKGYLSGPWKSDI